MAGLIESLPFVVLALAVPKQAPTACRPPRGLGLAALALSGAYHVSLTAKRGQTLGQSVLGIRVVDAKTAAVPTLKQSAVRWAVAMVPHVLAGLVPLSESAGATLARITDLQPEIDRLTRRHQGDRERLNEELMRLFKEADLNPLGACLPMVLRALPGLAMSCAVYGPLLQRPQCQALMTDSLGRSSSKHPEPLLACRAVVLGTAEGGGWVRPQHPLGVGQGALARGMARPALTSDAGIVG